MVSLGAGYRLYILHGYGLLFFCFADIPEPRRLADCGFGVVALVLTHAPPRLNTAQARVYSLNVVAWLSESFLFCALSYRGAPFACEPSDVSRLDQRTFYAAQLIVGAFAAFLRMLRRRVHRRTLSA